MSDDYGFNRNRMFAFVLVMLAVLIGGLYLSESYVAGLPRISAADPSRYD